MTLATIRTTLHDSRFDTNVRLYHCKLSLSNNRPILNTFDHFNFIENVQALKKIDEAPVSDIVSTV